MSSTTALRVCFASKESLGDQASDFAELPTTFKLTALVMSMTRVMVGSGPHLLTVSGAQPSDTVKLARGGCSANTSSYPVGQTSVYTVPEGKTYASVLLPITLEAGVFRVCHNDTLVHGLSFTVVDRPSFAPLGGQAGSVSTLTFGGGAMAPFLPQNHRTVCIIV